MRMSAALPLFLGALVAASPAPAPTDLAIRQATTAQTTDILNYIPSICIAPCLPVATYINETIVPVCGAGGPVLTTVLTCMDASCGATFFDHIVSCTNCIAGDFKANENFITGMDNVIQSIGQVCRIAGFDISMIAGIVTGGISSATSAAASAVGGATGTGTGTTGTDATGKTPAGTSTAATTGSSAAATVQAGVGSGATSVGAPLAMAFLGAVAAAVF